MKDSFQNIFNHNWWRDCNRMTIYRTRHRWKSWGNKQEKQEQEVRYIKIKQETQKQRITPSISCAVEQSLYINKTMFIIIIRSANKLGDTRQLVSQSEAELSLTFPTGRKFFPVARVIATMINWPCLLRPTGTEVTHTHTHKDSIQWNLNMQQDVINSVLEPQATFQKTLISSVVDWNVSMTGSECFITSFVRSWGRGYALTLHADVKRGALRCKPCGDRSVPRHSG